MSLCDSGFDLLTQMWGSYLAERSLGSVNHLSLIVRRPDLTGQEVFRVRLLCRADDWRVSQITSHATSPVELVVQQSQLELLDRASRELEQVQRVVQRKRVGRVHDVVIVGQTAENTVVFGAQVVAEFVSNRLEFN